LPAEGQTCVILGALDGNDDFFKQRVKQLLAIPIRGGRRGPDPVEVIPYRANRFSLLAAEHTGPRLFLVFQFGFGALEVAQSVFPFRFQSARHEPIFRVHCPVAAFGALHMITGALHRKPVLFQCRLVAGFKLLCGFERGFQRRWRQGCKERRAHRRIDLAAADVQAVFTPPVDDVFAGAVIAGRRVPTPVMYAQAPSAMSAGGDALQ